MKITKKDDLEFWIGDKAYGIMCKDTITVGKITHIEVNEKKEVIFKLGAEETVYFYLYKTFEEAQKDVLKFLKEDYTYKVGSITTLTEEDIREADPDLPF